MIVVNVNRPLLGLGGIIPTVRVVLSSFNFNLSGHHIALSASNMIPTLSGLNSVVSITLTVSLRTPGSRVHSRVIPVGGGCGVRAFLTTIHHCLRGSGTGRNHIAVRCIVLSRIGSNARRTRRLTRLLGSAPYGVGLVP